MSHLCAVTYLLSSALNSAAIAARDVGRSHSADWSQLCSQQTQHSSSPLSPLRGCRKGTYRCGGSACKTYTIYSIVAMHSGYFRKLW